MATRRNISRIQQGLHEKKNNKQKPLVSLAERFFSVFCSISSPFCLTGFVRLFNKNDFILPNFLVVISILILCT